MPDLICPNCAFANTADDALCKRCGQSLPTVSQPARPSVARIVKNYDYTILLVLFPIAFIGMFLLVDVFGLSVRRRGITVSPSDVPISLFLAVGTAALAAAVLAWRVAHVRGVFARGQEIAGRISKVLLNRSNSGYVHYSYMIDEREYHSKVGIAGRFVDPETVRAFQVGNEVALVVDPTRPKRALIKDLYVPSASQRTDG